MVGKKPNISLTFKTGDTFPSIVARFEDDAGQINLLGAEKVEIYLELMVGEGQAPLVVEGECTVTSAEEEVNGKLTKVYLATYTFLTSDSAVAGTYLLEHKITWAPGVIESVPNEDYKYIKLLPSL